MAVTLGLDLTMKLQWLFQTSLDLQNITDAKDIERQLTLTSGVGASMADRIWIDQLASIAASADTDLDLTALTQSIYGSTVTFNFVKVKGILVINDATTAGENLLIGGAGSNPFSSPFADASDKVKCCAKSFLPLCCPIDGWATSGSNKILRIHNSGAAGNTPTVVVFGTSA